MVGTRKVPKRKVVIPKRPANHVPDQEVYNPYDEPKGGERQRKGYKKGTGEKGAKSELAALWATTEEEDKEEVEEGEEKEDDENEVEGKEEISSDA